MNSTAACGKAFFIIFLTLVVLMAAVTDDYEGIPAGDGLLFDESEITFRTRSYVPKTDSRTAARAIMVGKINISNNKQLHSLYTLHKIDQLPMGVQKKFVDRYLMTMKRKYIPKGGLTYCTTYYYDYFNGMGYGDIISGMKNSYGKTMIEKALNYSSNTKKVKIIYSAYEAQQLANKGRDIGVIGEYYYDKAERYFTRHYAIVQPSLITFNNRKELLSYPVYGLISKYNVNNRDGTGAFLAQAGSANGLIDFRWSYNRKMNGIIQKTSIGKIRGGILFVLFPGKNITDKPTQTPGPTKTPMATRTPRPTKTPKATKTPRPTRTPRPTKTPKATKTPGPTPGPTALIGDALTIDPPEED